MEKQEDPASRLIQFSKRFDPVILLNYVSLTSSLPLNDLYQIRFETLFKIIMSIPSAEFRKETFTDNNACQLLTLLEGLTDWDPVEDIQPVSVLDYPAIWIMGKRYRIIPGALHRAHEYWKNLVAYYQPLQALFQKLHNYDPIQIIISVLELETELHSFIEKNKELYRQEGKVLAPPVSLTNEWKQILDYWYNRCPSKTFIGNHSVAMGAITISELIELHPESTLFRHFSIIANDCTVLTAPHCFIFVLQQVFEKDLAKIKPECSEVVTHTAQLRLFRALASLFKVNNVIPDFSVDQTITIHFGVPFDRDKLFLIDIVDMDITPDLDRAIEDVISKIQKLEDAIVAGKYDVFSGHTHIATLPAKPEIIPIIIVNTQKITSIVRPLRKDFFEGKAFMLNSLFDFIAIAKDIKTGMSLLKFLRREKELRDSDTLFPMSDFMDLYGRYSANKESFFRGGTVYASILFAPGIWDDYIIKTLRKKPDFQPRFATEEADDSWEFEELDDNTYFVYNIILQRSGIIFQTPDNRSFWIMATLEGIDYESIELSSFEFLGQLLAYRLSKGPIFQEFLKSVGASARYNIRFSLFPNSLISRQKMTRFGRLVQKLSPSSPIVTEGFAAFEHDIIFPLVYSPELLSEIFDSDSIQAEKLVIRTVFEAIQDFIADDNSEADRSVIETYLNQIYQTAVPSFSFTTISHPIIIDQRYGFYQKVMDSDLSEMQRLTAKHMIEKSIKPGLYYKKQAKEIINVVYTFLKGKLSEELAQIDHKTLIPYAINELGATLQVRYSNRRQLENDIARIKGYDPLQRYLDQDDEITIHSTAIRYLIEVTTQLGATGPKEITSEKWLELLAMSHIVVTATYVSDSLYYGIAEYRLRIDENYEYSIEIESHERIDKFKSNMAKSLIEGNSRSDVSAQVPSSINEVDNAFNQEFGVTFEVFQDFLSVVMSYPKTMEKYTATVSEKDLIAFAKTKLRISEATIVNALKLASIDRENLVGEEIMPSHIRNRPNRLIVRPIVSLLTTTKDHLYVINSWLTFLALSRWRDGIIGGNLPYNENFIQTGTLKDNLTEIRRKAGRAYERKVEEFFKSKTKYCNFRVKDNEQCFQNLPEPCPGEIDALVILPTQRKIFIIDSKDLQMNLAPRDVSNEIEKFTKKKGYIDMLLLKRKYVITYLQRILSNLGISNLEVDWAIKCLFVTSNATFFNQEAEDFLGLFTLGKLEELFQA
jgi:hypothetical protein